MMSPLHFSMQNWLKQFTCDNHKDSEMALTVSANWSEVSMALNRLRDAGTNTSMQHCSRLAITAPTQTLQYMFAKSSKMLSFLRSMLITSSVLATLNRD